MRLWCVLALLSFAAASSAAAQAERRVFIIPNDAGGYGVDRCLATGASCGTAIATAYCRAREFDQALSFRKIERGEITGTAPASAA